MPVSGLIRPLRAANSAPFRCGVFLKRRSFVDLTNTNTRKLHHSSPQRSLFHNGRSRGGRSPLSLAGGLVGRRLAVTHTRLGLRWYNRPYRDLSFLDTPDIQVYRKQVRSQWDQGPEPIKMLLRVFLGIYVLHKLFPWFSYHHFSFKRSDFKYSRFHTLITNNVSHRRLLHLIINSVLLFVIGPVALHYCGGNVKKFYLLYFGCGVGGSLFSMSNLGPNQAVLGSSPSIFGMMAFVAMHTPYQQIMFFGIFPIKLWQLVAGLLTIEIFSMGGHQYQHQNDPTSHESHVAGLLGGFAFYYWLSKLTI